jgi:hypothetical protein
VIFATAAQAQVGWSSAGTGFVPTGATLGKYESVNAAGIRFTGNEVGNLVFTCSMDRFNSGTTNWMVRISYRDSTGSTTTAAVVARVYRIPISDYAPVSLKTVTSNSSATTTKNTIDSSTFTHMFDFDVNVYFVQVTLSRAASSQIIELYSVVLMAAAA